MSDDYMVSLTPSQAVEKLRKEFVGLTDLIDSIGKHLIYLDAIFSEARKDPITAKRLDKAKMEIDLLIEESNSFKVPDIPKEITDGVE